jgi:hypothetical protein
MVDFQEADSQIRSMWKIEAGSGKRNMVIGFFGARLKEADQWLANGFRDEADYRNAVGVSTNIWGRYVRIAQCFPLLDVQRFVLMSAENAEELGRLPEDYRYNHMWLENAVKLKAEDFKRLALQVRASEAGVPVKEMRVKFSIPMFENQREVIEHGLSQFQTSHGISDRGTALEWLVAEYSNRNTFARFIHDQLPLMEAALKGGDPANAVGLHIVAMYQMLDSLKEE